jgi:hypothetical protein
VAGIIQAQFLFPSVAGCLILLHEAVCSEKTAQLCAQQADFGLPKNGFISRNLWVNLQMSA